MHYYYDLLVNLDTELWEFYEWENEDHLVPIKKIPLIRVLESDIRNFMKYEVTMDPEWISALAEKTIFKNASDKTNCLLFSSTKNSIVLEFDSYGNVVSRSKLLIEDENNCNEVSCNLKETEVPYKVHERLELRSLLRQQMKEKHLLEIELKTLKESNNVAKCSYLYYEWFGILESDMEKMIQDFKKDLEKGNLKKLHKIVKIIRLSYKGQL